MTTLMRLRTTRLGEMKEGIRALRQVTPDAVFRCLPWGIRTFALDRPHETSIVRFDMEKDAIVSEGGEYTRSSEAALNLGVPLDNLSAALGTARANDTLVLEAVASAASASASLPRTVLRVRLTNAKGRDSVHDINLLDMDAADLKFPQPEAVRGARRITLDSAALHDACKCAHACKSNHVLFALTPNDLLVQSVGGLGKVSENVPVGENDVRDVGIGPPGDDDQTLLSTVFNFKTVYCFVRAFKMAREVEVVIAPHFPLIMTYRIETLGSLTIYVAPYEHLTDAEKIQHKELIDFRV